MSGFVNKATGWICAGLFIAFIQIQPVEACTRVLWSNSQGVFSGRTMDWPESTQPVITVFPRGLHRDGSRAGQDVFVHQNPAKWTSRYGSMVTSLYGMGTADGFNEKGLAAHMLYLNETVLPARDIKKPGLQIGLWAQYVLDNAATVSEALLALEKVQLVMAEAHGRKGYIHLVMEDANGDSAIIEYIGTQAIVHHNKAYRVVTNDPAYNEQLALLKKFDFSHPSSDTPLPGNVKATDRFQRASYYAALLPEPPDKQQAIASLMAVIRNVSVPFGAPYKDFGIYNTEYRTVMDLTDKRYFFELTTSPNVIWADLNQFDLATGAPTMTLDPHQADRSGNVSKFFKPETQAPY